MSQVEKVFLKKNNEDIAFFTENIYLCGLRKNEQKP
jgi:hypothetical protein